MASDSAQPQRERHIPTLEDLIDEVFDDSYGEEVDVDDMMRRIETLPQPYRRAMYAAMYALVEGHTIDLVLAVFLRIIQDDSA